MAPIALAIASAVSIHIAGAAVPLTAFRGVPQIAADVIRHSPAKKTIIDSLSVAASVAGVINPVAGIAITVAVFALEHSRPMTPQEERAWMDRMSIATQ